MRLEPAISRLQTRAFYQLSYPGLLFISDWLTLSRANQRKGESQDSRSQSEMTEGESLSQQWQTSHPNPSLNKLYTLRWSIVTEPLVVLHRVGCGRLKKHLIQQLNDNSADYIMRGKYWEESCELESWKLPGFSYLTIHVCLWCFRNATEPVHSAAIYAIL